jgi:hypothetical protein
MKNSLLFVALFGVASLIAQETKNEKLTIEKGTWNIGGNFSVSFAKNDTKNELQSIENEFTSISFVPNVGYALGKNIITGLSFGYGYGKSESSLQNEGKINSSNSNNYRTLSVSPYIRGYLPIG